MDGLKARLSFDAVAYDYDDEYLTIDTDTHIININNLSRLFGVQYDGNSKLIKFRISNKLSDIQKMQDSIVYINWIDSKGVKGQSIAINKTINNDTCEFAWKVPFDALKNSRVLHFAMSAVITANSSSVIDQRWSTQIASVIIPDGIYIKSYIPSSEEEDRIAQIYSELSKMINKQNEGLKADIDVERKRIDVLNDGGLIIKDELIENNIRTWLSEHPEATTTVRDESISIKKISNDLRLRFESAFAKGAFENLKREYRYASYNNTYKKLNPHTYRQQGGCIVDGEKVVHFCTVYGEENEKSTKIIEVSLKEKKVIREKYINLGHANCVSYDNGFLYVSGDDGYTDYKIDYDTLSDIAEIKSSIKHSEIYIYNEALYLYDGASIYKSGEKIFDVEMDGTEQSMCVSIHGIFFVRSNPYCIYHYAFNGKLLNIYDIKGYYGIYATGETEALAISGDKAYVFTNSGLDTTNSDYWFFNVFTTNLYIGTYSFRSNTNENFADVLYVDKSNENLNPDGTESNPFSTITEAVLTLESNKKKYIYINIASGEYYEKLYLKGISSFLNIYGSDVVINGIIDATYAQSVYVNGISIRYNEKEPYMVKFNCCFVPYCNVTLIDNPLNNNPVYISNCSNPNLVINGLNGGYVSVFGDIPVSYGNQVTRNKKACISYHASTAIYNGSGKYTPPINISTNYRNSIYNALELSIQSMSYFQSVTIRFDSVNNVVTSNGVLIIYIDKIIFCPWTIKIDVDGSVQFSAGQSYALDGKTNDLVAGLRDITYKRI